MPAGERSFRPVSFALFLALILPVSKLCAQVDTGAVLGTVKDQSGAVVPGAKVTMTNVGTGIAITTAAGTDGAYVFRPVKVGTYSVAGEFQGFRTAEQQNVQGDVQQPAVADLTF